MNQYYHWRYEDLPRYVQTTSRNYHGKTGEIFRSHENSIMQLISGNSTLTNQRLDNLSKKIAGLQ